MQPTGSQYHRHHPEEHFRSSEIVRDAVLGMSDGLTVPFALAAGLSGALDSSRIIVTAGLAEIAAGSIAMGLGGYLAAKTYAEHYAAEHAREHLETIEKPEVEAHEVASIFRSYGLHENTVGEVVNAIKSDRKRWIDFMMRFELGLEKPEPGRAVQSGLVIGVSYIVGGILPLFPYFFIHHPPQALKLSCGLTVAALFVFGYIKGRITTAGGFKSAWRTTAIGGIAAAVAYFVAKLVS